MYQMRYGGRLIQLALNSMLDILRQDVFNSTTVKELIWGYHHTLIKLGNDVLPEEKKLPFDQFGFFVNKNGSLSEEWETNTGMKDVKDVATYRHHSAISTFYAACCFAQPFALLSEI